MMWTLIIANIIAALVLMAWANQLAEDHLHAGPPGAARHHLLRASSAPGRPATNIGDWITLIVFGAIGVVMKTRRLAARAARARLHPRPDHGELAPHQHGGLGLGFCCGRSAS